MSGFFIGIPVLNTYTLLRRAIYSIPEKYRENILVLNNGRKPVVEPLLTVETPLVPYSFSQSMNYFQATAEKEKCPWYMTMHSDAEAEEGTIEKLIERAKAEQSKWGVMFTAYDALAAFNIQAGRGIGPWDVNLPWYLADVDYYRRLELAGWAKLDTSFPVKHNPSQTLKADVKLDKLNGVLYPLARIYYAQKWNGFPGEEKWTRPWNGALDD